MDASNPGGSGNDTPPLSEKCPTDVRRMSPGCPQHRKQDRTGRGCRPTTLIEKKLQQDPDPCRSSRQIPDRHGSRSGASGPELQLAACSLDRSLPKLRPAQTGHFFKHFMEKQAPPAIATSPSGATEASEGRPPDVRKKSARRVE